MSGAEAQGAAAEKSPEAFRTIREVSEELDEPQHVLRFWETRFPQIRPVKRGGGRRHYRPEDVALLRRIRSLLRAEGYSIRGVRKLLNERGVAALRAEAPSGRESRAAEHALDPEAHAEAARILEELETLRDMLRTARVD